MSERKTGLAGRPGIDETGGSVGAALGDEGGAESTVGAGRGEAAPAAGAAGGGAAGLGLGGCRRASSALYAALHSLPSRSRTTLTPSVLRSMAMPTRAPLPSRTALAATASAGRA